MGTGFQPVPHQQLELTPTKNADLKLPTTAVKEMLEIRRQLCK